MLTTKFKVQTSPDYVWSDYCTKYFTVRHNVTPAIQRLLDTYESDRGLNDVDRHGNEAYDTTGSYWKMRLDTLWEFMDEIYSGTDADTLETKWSQMWLHKGVKFLQFWSDFETTAREVARSRGCSSAKLTDSEMKCRLHASLPAKCQTFLNERGYKLPGAQGMSYQEVVQAAKAWAQVHWDPHCNAKDVCGVTCETTEDSDYQVNAVAMNPGAPTRTTSSHSTTKPSDRPNEGSASAKANKPARTRADDLILNADNNRRIIRARCGRCLDKGGVSHLPEVCEQELELESERCLFCGLCHGKAYFCPRQFDSYGVKCGRCGRMNHSSLACRQKKPGVKDIQAISLLPYRGLSQVVTISINGSKAQTALLDSGAMISVMHKRVFDALPGGHMQDTMIRLRTANCSSPVVVGKAVGLVVRFEDGTEAPEDFVIAEKLAKHIYGPKIKPDCPDSRRREEYQLTELCYLAVDHETDSEEDDSDSDEDPEIPTDVLLQFAQHECPPRVESDSSDLTPCKGLSDAQRAQRTLRGYQQPLGDDGAEAFDWKLKPPTPRSTRGRFCLSIPWKGATRPDTSSNGVAMRRARLVSARLTPEVQQAYHKVITDLRDLGFTRPTTKEALTHIIPSMPVVRPGAVSTKVRLVLDASVQLNQHCREGPPPNDRFYCQTLAGNLHCFRLSPAVVISDISKAFHRIEMEAADQKFLGMCTVNENGDLTFDQWLSMIFGANYAPSGLNQSTQAALIMHDVYEKRLEATEAKELDPVVKQLLDTYLEYRRAAAAKDVVQDPENGQARSSLKLLDRVAVYVDDSQSRGPTPEEAEQTADEVDCALGGHGFPPNDVKKYRSWEKPDTSYLGYRWSHDKLSVRYEPKSELLSLDPERMSRKQAFGLVMAFYDPLGFGVELASCLRALARASYESSKGWDEPIDQEVASRLLRLARAVNQEAMPRTLTPRTVHVAELYLFTDASGVASCQLLYDAEFVRVVGNTHLWTRAEGRWTIPKKETLSYCSGMTMLSDYCDLVRQHGPSLNNTTLRIFVDSELIIYRLRRLAKNKKIKTITALEYRKLKYALKVLNDLTDETGCKVAVLHLSGLANPADVATRPTTTGELPPTIDIEQLKDEVRLAVRNDFSFVPNSEKVEDCDLSDGTDPHEGAYDALALDLEEHFTPEKIIEMQEADPKVMAQIAALRTTPEADLPPSLRLYHLDGNTLYYHGVTSVVQERRRAHQVPVIPMNGDVVRLMRELPDGGATQTRLRRLVRQIENSCPTCRRTKRRGCVRRAFGVVRPSGLVFDAGQVWCMDFAGPFVETASVEDHGQKKWVLTLMCPSSYQTIYDVLPSTKTEAVTAATQKLFAVVGPPFAVVFDPGSTFNSSVYIHYLEDNNIAYATLPRDCQHYGGLFERFHGVLLRQIRSRLSQARSQDEELTIDKAVADSVSMINRLPLQEMGGLTPHELFFCRKPRYPTGQGGTSDDEEGRRRLAEWLPGIIEFEKDKLLGDLTEICHDISSRRCDNLVDYFDYLLERSDRIRNRMAKAPLKRGATVKFKAGDLVLRYKHGNLKQEGMWIGPYKVLKANSSGTIYQLATMSGAPLRYLEAIFNLRSYEDPPRVIDSYAVREPEEGDDEAVVPEQGYDGLHPVDILDGIEADERVMDEVLHF
ncbi:hypothetical protein FOZ60_013389 [Perkinsus olseni]|uniref:Integrase catalytic domain-containing protein n=1 Tax=Perkinsus olseni TaxID=32597 RepID=A0A7J6PLP1_PEROL|nr:hypothetical protein FOZ60_013389 [Perkinsus olseni]